jgi:predicted nuclease with TOPRIM domain
MAGSGVPEIVRRTWGAEVVEAFVPWLEEMVQEKAVLRDEYREVLSRLDRLEADVSDLKTEVRDLRREMNERFDRLRQDVDERFDRLRQDVDERFDRLYDRMLVQNRWLVGSIALFGTVISILLGIGQLVK